MSCYASFKNVPSSRSGDNASGIRVFCFWRLDFNHVNKTRDNRAIQLGQRFDTVLVTRSSRKIGEHVRCSGVKLVQIKDRYPNHPFIYMLIYYINVIFVFWKENKAKRFNLIYSLAGEEPLGWLLKKFSKDTKWIVDLFDNPELFRSKGLTFKRIVFKCYRVFLKRIIRQADIVIAGIMPYVLKTYEIDERRLIITTNGVNLQLFDPCCYFTNPEENSTVRILYVGHLLKERGLDVLLLACSHLLNRDITNFQLELVGFFGYNSPEQVKSEICQHGLEKHVTLVGEIPSSEIPAKLADVDICVHPFPNKVGLAEIYPVKIYEYLAMSKAVVASDLPGVRTLIQDGYNGLLFQPSNPEDLADKLEFLITNPPEREKLAKNARPSVSQYGWNIVLDKLFREIEACV